MSIKPLLLLKMHGGEKTEFIESNSSMMIPSKSTSDDNKEKAFEERSNTDLTVCEQEQALSENERINVTKETLTFKWYGEPEDWDRLAPDANNDAIEEMMRRHRELYSIFLRLTNLKNQTTKNENKILPSNQKKEIQDEVKRV